MIDVMVQLTDDEAKLLKITMERANDKNDCREQWKSQEMRNLEVKVIAAVLLAEIKKDT